ncbi:outer membrane protein assembly factor [Polaribacter sp. PL03]|uniref:outer membrane protein assembly factor n=1 Tax=Polaribacter sp. PL03 TaxID=3088353 RepID=UPI0029CD53D4|nr:outer membrane protein assembly factor [Polaribacter sp. PL03]MDX6746520.1 outer membrane protein assembly factor [Polaribacter sp. PL03]
MLQLYAQQNRITSLEIIGNKKTKTTYLKKIIATEIGLVLDSVAIEKDVVFLKRLPAVSHAYYQVKKVGKNKYQVKIGIEENFTIIPELNFWTTTNKRFAYKLGLYDYNFLGENITFGGFYQNNGFNSYGINFRAPNLFSKKLGLAVTHQNWKSEEPLYFDDKSANYLYNNISFEVLGLYQFNLKNSIDFGLNIFSEKYTYLSGATDVSIPLNLDLDKKLIKFVYKYNNLDYYYQYVSGFKSVLYAQYVTSKNAFQNDFLIAWNDFFYFKRVGAKGNWANKLRIGFSSNEKSPFAPFALDNNVNIRGVGILVDRGTGVAVLNSEYRHTIYDKKWLAIQTNVFTDIGSWRDPGGKLNDFFESEKIRVFSGIGLRFISKKIYNATFRIDYGFKVYDGKNNSNGGLVFGLGQYF